MQTDDLLQLVTAYLLERQILVVAPDKGAHSSTVGLLHGYGCTEVSLFAQAFAQQ